MLTFILLVVLAGGVGLIAVSTAERNDPATPWSRSRRGRHTTDHAGHLSDESRIASVDDTAARPVIGANVPAEVPGPARRRSRGAVPAQLTAVEGAFDTVALRPPSRRLLSLVLIVTLVIVFAAVIAGVIGTAAAIVGRLLDSAIG